MEKIGRDIFFISYDEPNADRNWQAMSLRFPRAERVHGGGGIFAAHAECAKRARTAMFFTVDADNEIDPGFDFFSSDPADDPSSVYVWRCRNAVNDLVYGYGAIKLYPRIAFSRQDARSVDIATSRSLHYRIVPEVASVTRFNSDPFSAWRGAFRECVKLASGAILNQVSRETQQRLEAWCALGGDRPFGKECIEGAREGREYGAQNRDRPEDLTLINDYLWLKRRYHERR